MHGKNGKQLLVMTKPILEVDSVICGFGDRNLLTDVYLKCQPGEIIGILGRNGCGKSTLLKIIFGTQSAQNSWVRINGKVYAQAFKSQLINYLPQHNCFPRSISLQKIIALFIPDKKRREALYSNVHFEKHLGKKIGELSGGESRYCQILLLLELNAPFLMLDEPFSGIEPLFREEIKSLLLSYKQHKAIIITDHDYRNILEVSDSIKLLVNGVCKHIKHVDELERWHYVPPGTFTDDDGSRA